ncbi:hypothetical protein GCM10027570_27750 [Streptomonospora sediminis]
MATMTEHLIVLVHSPLVGPLTWDPTAAHLRDKGHRVAVPSLTAVADEGPPYYRKFTEAAVSALGGEENNGRVVLVGHSGAGPLLPAIAEAVGDGVRGSVFVDALLPHPGRSWFDTAPPPLREQVAGLARAGRLPRWNEWFPAGTLDTLVPDAGTRERFVAELPELPVAFFEEPAPTVRGGAPPWCAYVRLSAAYDQEAADAERRGWWVHRENADHLAVLTRPQQIADVIEQAIGVADV